MKKALCFISCCKAKEASGKIMQPSSALSPADLPLNWQRLQIGRQRMAVHVSTNTPSTSAVELYQGSFYQALGDIKDEVCQWHSLSNYRLAIISAGYGLLDAREPAHEYDIKMSGKIARAWREFDLVEIIAELILKEQAEKMFGFFAGSTTWNHAGSKYRFFFTEGLRLAIAFFRGSYNGVCRSTVSRSNRMCAVVSRRFAACELR
jgi:hypothetical protein